MSDEKTECASCRCAVQEQKAFGYPGYGQRAACGKAAASICEGHLRIERERSQAQLGQREAVIADLRRQRDLFIHAVEQASVWNAEVSATIAAVRRQEETERPRSSLDRMRERYR